MMQLRIRLLILLLVMLVVTACVPGPEYVPHPLAPRVTLNKFGPWEKHGVYDAQDNVIRELPWEWVGNEYVGWTRHLMDWEEEVIRPEAEARKLRDMENEE